MKLKKLLEGFVWERTPGKALPTMKDVADAYQKNLSEDNFDTRLKSMMDKTVGKGEFEKATDQKSEWPVWQVVFDNGSINGVEYSSSKSFRVKARSTVEAIKKATKLAGGDVVQGDWMVVDILKLKKL